MSALTVVYIWDEIFSMQRVWVIAAWLGAHPSGDCLGLASC